MRKISQIKEFIDTYTGEAVELLEELGKIPAPSYQEEKRAEFCFKWFQEQGADDVWIDEAKNVVCALDCDKYEDIVVFMAHTDIVFSDIEELPMRKKGRKLYAPGIGDDTANLVNLMMGAKYFLQNRKVLKKGIFIVANSCEEGLGNLNGCKEIFNKHGHRITEFYSFDGYLSQCTSIPVGSYRYRISVKGEGGHSYLDFGRENAIHILALLICDLYEIEVPLKEKTTFNIGRIEGGSTVNSIPQDVSMLYEFRSPNQKCLDVMEEKFNEVISAYKNDGKKIEVELLGVRPGRGDIDEVHLKEWTGKNISIIKNFYDGELDLQPFSTDANIPLSRGIVANTIGTVIGGDAHKREEWVDLESLPVGMSIVISLLNQYVI